MWLVIWVCAEVAPVTVLMVKTLEPSVPQSCPLGEKAGSEEKSCTVGKRSVPSDGGLRQRTRPEGKKSVVCQL